MPLPAQYSEATFADYLTSVLDEVGTVIGWDAGSVQVIEAVNDAVLDLGVATIAEATTPRQMRGLRALGRRAIWRAVVQAVSGKYDFRDSDATFSRSQIHEMAMASLNLAETESMEFNPQYSATVMRVSRPHDPYLVLPDEQRVP